MRHTYPLKVGAKYFHFLLYSREEIGILIMWGMVPRKGVVMDYEAFAKEYRRLFSLIFEAEGAISAGWAIKMARLADSVPSEWVDKVEEEG